MTNYRKKWIQFNAKMYVRKTRFLEIMNHDGNGTINAFYVFKKTFENAIVPDKINMASDDTREAARSLSDQRHALRWINRNT